VVSPKTKRAVGYVRVSVDRENETSTETQEERIRAYCVAHGWDVVDVVVEPGKSAYKVSYKNRPKFRRVMDLVRSGAANAVVVWKLDRACRDTRDTLDLVDELAGQDAQFASVTEHFDTSTPSGKMMLTVLSALAEMESSTKSERVEAWHEHRRTNGATPGGPTPFGYRRERNELHIVEGEAAVIRKAAAAVLDGRTTGSIIKDLSAAGVVGRTGSAFTNRSLQKILTSPTTAACREVDGVFIQSDAWEPILDRETWEKVRRILKDPARRTNGSNTARRWLLVGILRCARCLDTESKGWMRVVPHRAGPRYVCKSCYCSVSVPLTDEYVEGLLLGLLDKRAWRALRRGRSIGDIDTGFDDAMGVLTDKFVAGDIDGTELGRLADALRAEAASAPPPPALPDVDDLHAAWPKLDLEARRLVLSACTESLTVLPSGPRFNKFDGARIKWVSV
jgi:DNA invertase Pin-like site-specific DNA recombinase